MAKTRGKAGSSADARQAERSADGVDLTLIRWMLSLTPAQRLQVAQGAAESLRRMRAERTKD
jgi:hypothetical protein